MDLFLFPAEIRLKIYSELLAHDECLVVMAGKRGRVRPYLFVLNCQLYPEILCTSKRVHSEAISPLYSDNSFRFSEPYSTAKPPATVTSDVFLEHIGPRAASLLRYVYTRFPTPPHAQDYQLKQTALVGLCLDNLNILLQASPGITTLDLALPSKIKDLGLRDTPFFGETLDMIEEKLGSFKSLQQVKIELRLLEWESAKHSDDGEEEVVVTGDSYNSDGSSSSGSSGSSDEGSTRWKAHRDSLMRQLRSRGWAVHVTKVPRVWTTSDGMWFTDKAGYIMHMRDLWENEMEQRSWEWQGRGRDIECARGTQEYAYRMGWADDGGPA
ncbi:hypothetical protein MAPG_01207 [Magnaporthiopsis poae ATCC 64411]|uniref:Uncharacterized protein n=1 Tax=Magnaporthiopsis poae (strain ATCC 64411 / 73-15) TaxID=644358 RepID=A0A0C4DN33_MAGP6|nr:hypothetical protein MAPG_01207 [Magnaporthiopsis poae ATCC 64411]